MAELAEGARLESGCRLIPYRGFESPSLRQMSNTVVKFQIDFTTVFCYNRVANSIDII